MKEEWDREEEKKQTNTSQRGAIMKHVLQRIGRGFRRMINILGYYITDIITFAVIGIITIALLSFIVWAAIYYTLIFIITFIIVLLIWAYKEGGDTIQ